MANILNNKTVVLKRLFLLSAMILASGCYTAKNGNDSNVKTHYYIDKWGKTYYFFETVPVDSLIEKDKNN